MNLSKTSLLPYLRLAWVILLVYAGTLAYAAGELGMNDGLALHSQVIVFICMWLGAFVFIVSIVTMYPLIVDEMMRQESVELHRRLSAIGGLSLWVVCGIMLDGSTGEFFWVPW